MSIQLTVVLLALAFGSVSCVSRRVPPLPESDLAVGELLFADDFNDGLGQWRVEAERPGSISARDGTLDIDVPAGATVWFKPELSGPILIEYEATAISAGGPNDRVSDLNRFWMARDARDLDDLFAVARSGRFADYNELLAYYVGLGGNANTNTRFRRYVGSATTRPLLPEHDLRAAADLLVANRPQRIRLVAAGNVVRFYRDDRMLIDFADDRPYTRGRFALRTVDSHLAIRRLRIYRLAPTS